MNKFNDVLVIGDIIIDSYIKTKITRISGEAPILIAKKISTESRLGGAANVAHNIVTLTNKSMLSGVVGDDRYKNICMQLLNKLNISNEIQIDKNSITITKERIINENFVQLLRIDDDDKVMKIQLNKKLKKAILSVDIVVLSNYDFGTLELDNTQQIIKYCNKHNIPTLVDPKYNSWVHYVNATLIKSNLKELQSIFPMCQNNNDSIKYYMKIACSKFKIGEIIVTLDSKGSIYYSSIKNQYIQKECRNVNVADVSGAGDTFIASISIMYGKMKNMHDLIRFANNIASLSVTKKGTSPVYYYEIPEKMTFTELPTISTNDYYKNIIKQWKANNEIIIFTNGIFDILHPGHIYLIEEAKKLGTKLIIGLNTDKSTKLNKGDGRPINNLKHRKNMLNILRIADLIIEFDTKTPDALLKSIKPSIIVKDGDYALKDIVGRQYAKQVVLIPRYKTYSTTNVIHKITKQK